MVTMSKVQGINAGKTLQTQDEKTTETSWMPGKKNNLADMETLQQSDD